MMRWISTILLTALLGQEPYTLNIDVPVVTIDVTALNDRDEPVSDLSREDFSIYEDGVAQEIRFFSPVSAPYNVLLLFDSSLSTIHDREFMKATLTRFIGVLRDQDRLSIASFDDQLRIDLEWSPSRTRALAAAESVARRADSNGTRFYASLDRALQTAFKGVAGRRAVVVLTDGEDTAFAANSKSDDLRKLLQTVRRERIPIWIITIPNQPPSPVVFESTLKYFADVQTNMKELAEISGASVLESRSASDIAGLYEEIGRRLGTAYSLGYVPSNAQRDGRVRKVEVKIGSGFRVVQSRTSYTPAMR
jgi:Ca-activated chloride channel family protein